MSIIFRSCLAVAFLLAAFAARASVWFGDEEGLHRVDTSANRADLNIRTSEPVALAVNSTDGSVWALTRSRIARYSADGTRIFSRELDSIADHAGDGRRVAVNAANGSAWVMCERRILHLGTNGSLLSAIWSSATDLAVAQDGTLWVLDEGDNELRRYADQGALLSRTPLGGASREARHIALDDTRGTLWLGGEYALVKRSLSDPSTVLRTVTTSQKVSDLSLDVQTGDLWVLGSSSLYGYRADGARFLSEYLGNDGVYDPESLAFDLGTQAIWVGHERGLSRFDRSGDRIATIRADEVDTVAVSRAAVVIDPVIALLSPAPGALLNDPRPAIVFQYGALCAGVPCAFPPEYFASFSITALLNGASVGSQFVFDPATGQTRYTPPSPLPQGVNTLTAEAVDAAGKVSPRVSSQFSVDSIAPQFVDVTPASGSTFTSAQVTIQGATDDASARVRLSGTPGDSPSSFSFPVTLASGVNAFTLTATDPAGNATQLPLTYTYTPPNVPPTVAITAPGNGATFTAPATIAVTATASDPDGSVTRVDFFRDGVTAGTDTTTPYAASLDGLGAGNYVLTAAATDDRGATTTSAPVTITVVPPNAPPTVVLGSPANGASFTEPATIVLEATASDPDGTIARVEFLQGGSVVASIAASPYRHTLSGVVAGTYAFAARAVDNAGASTVSATATVTVNAGPPNTPPTVKLTSPTSGAAFSAPGMVPVSATAADADGTIVKVEFLRNGVVEATVNSAPYNATLTNVPAGSHVISARATDDRGAVTTSATVTITATALQLTIASPAPNATIAGDNVLVTGSISGMANSGVVLNGIVAPVDATGNFFALASLTAGANTITVTLTAPDGAVTSRSVNVTATGTGSPFLVFGDPVEGLAPLAVTFTVTNPTGEDATFLFDAFGPFALPAGAALQLGLTYPAGIHVPTVVITAAGGATYTHRVVVDSRDPARMDQMLRAIWTGFTDSLLAGDREGALRALNGGAQFKFGPVFDALMPQMGTIIASWSTLAQSSLQANVAEYAVSRMDGAQRRLFMIYFVQDADGVWRIDEM